MHQCIYASAATLVVIGTRVSEKASRHACTESVFAERICEILDYATRMILGKILLDCLPLAAGFVNPASRQVLASLLDVMLRRLKFASGL